jgi:translation initiation factor IF-3
MAFKAKKKKLNNTNDDLKYNKEVYVVEENGLHKMGYYYAQKKADDLSLDLVEISKKDNLPVCKIFNYEKFLYEQKKKQNKPTNQEIKEIRLSSSIAKNDLEVKAKAAKRFINEKNKVKVTLQFKGRENANKEFYKKSLLEFIVLTEDFAVPESVPKDEGNKCIVFLKPKK